MRKNTRKTEATTSLRIQKLNDRKESSKTFHQIQNKFKYDLIRIFKINQIAQKIKNQFSCSLNSTSKFSPFEFHISYLIYSSSQISPDSHSAIQFNSNCIKFEANFRMSGIPPNNKQTNLQDRFVNLRSKNQ